MSKTLLYNIGTLISGDITNPVLAADAILLEDGRIAAVGSATELRGSEPGIDCAGATVTPGLIDSHCHPVFGDFTPRQSQLGFIESALHGGVTTSISAGEVHLPGRPTDAAGTKALAILAAKTFARFRPGGAKVIGGALILEKGLTEADMAEMAREGVRLVGEIGLGSVKNPEDAAPMVTWAKKHGMTVMMHTGGTSIPGSSTVTAEMVMRTDPDIVSHINGGTTAVSLAEALKLITATAYWLEIVHCGNPLIAVKVIEAAMQHGALERILLGNDAPSGTGVIPLGLLRIVTHLASLTDLPAAAALCMATGNNARAHKLDCGFVRPGLAADMVIMDTPMGSVGRDALAAIKAGDLPGIGMVLVDGRIVLQTSRNTPPPVRKPVVVPVR